MAGKVTEMGRSPQTEGSVRSKSLTFVACYEQDFAWLYRLLQRLGIAAGAIEDLAQEVFATAFERWNDFDTTRPVRPWLMGIAYRKMLDHNRKASTTRESALEDTREPHTDVHPEELASRSQGLSVALAILESLSLEQRAIFVMHELEGWGMPEVAATLEVPLNTAYSRLRLARQKFNTLAEAARGKAL